MKQLLKVVEVLPKRQFDSKTGEKIEVVPMRDVYFYPKSRVSAVFTLDARDCLHFYFFTFADFAPEKETAASSRCAPSR